MSRRVILLVRVVGAVTVIGTLVGQIMVLPDLAASLAARYPEAAHLKVPMLTASAMCLVPIQLAAVLSWPLARSLGNGARGPRVAMYLGGMAIALATSAALGVGTLIWAGAQTLEFGLQPGIGLALMVFSGACLVATGLVWRGRGRMKATESVAR